MQRKEQKLEELYEQLSTVERDRSRLRETCIRFEEENKLLATQCEEKKIEIAELKKHIEIYEEKLAQQSTIREEKLNTHIQTIKDLEREIDARGKRLRDLAKEKEQIELRLSEELAQVREELEVARERIMLMQKNENLIEVYKKKIEKNAQLQQDLAEY